ncbi:MAG TPA: hypothetical protein VFK06_22150 [Candidatus Angelobacter sp.]|nr:hypothetical protein [Candidatus Angelobacter sp.]
MLKQKSVTRFLGRCWKAFGVRLVIVLVLIGVLVFAPTGANGQLGLDPCCAIISAGLQSISGLLKSVVAKPLSQIQQIEQQAVNFEQQVVYPASAITSARGLASQFQGQLRQMSRVYQLPTNSATLPTPQQLEQALLSHSPQATAQIGDRYTAVYGGVMSAQDAPQPVRDMVDATDAEAQAALKKAVEIDALADIEIAAADKINQQIQSAAPGSAPILEAQAAAWNVRANAYTQSAMAELMRVRSIDLANASANVKFSAGSNTALKNATGNVLGRTK